MNEFHFKECSPQNVVSIKKAMKQFRNNTSVVDNYNNLLKDTKTAISNIEQCINSIINKATVCGSPLIFCEMGDLFAAANGERMRAFRQRSVNDQGKVAAAACSAQLVCKRQRGIFVYVLLQAVCHHCREH